MYISIETSVIFTCSDARKRYLLPTEVQGLIPRFYSLNRSAPFLSSSNDLMGKKKQQKTLYLRYQKTCLWIVSIWNDIKEKQSCWFEDINCHNSCNWNGKVCLYWCLFRGWGDHHCSYRDIGINYITVYKTVELY